ncbi:MAG: hypothetical protein MJ025_00440 [Victivallaceae bacterium]|nr:hypothetical protein [Victivallaceae bacterium]
MIEKMREIVLVTGSGGDAQGWGDMHVTEALRDAVLANGRACSILTAETPKELRRGLANRNCVVWSALYFFSTHADIIGSAADATWVPDLLDEWGIPYIGSSARTMKNMIGKFSTHELLERAGVNVPRHVLCPPGKACEIGFLPAFVKPNGESRSKGISEKSVAENMDELKEQIDFINKEFDQEALVEEFLPGREYTVLVVGDGDTRQILPGMVDAPEESYGKHHILRSDMRGVGLTKISIPQDHFDDCVVLAARAADALECRDHIRIDMREDATGKLRIMEVNGIPGLKPGRSWSPQIYALYHDSANPYAALIGAIIGSHK